MSYTGASVMPPKLMSKSNVAAFEPSSVEIFVKKGVEKFGDRYDYSNLKWLPNKVGYENGKCYVTEDFDIKEDWWQLYPPTMKPYTVNYLELENQYPNPERNFVLSEPTIVYDNSQQRNSQIVYCDRQPKVGTPTISTFSLGEIERDNFDDMPSLSPI